MNIGFACTADVGEGDVAIVVGRVTAEQVRQVGLGCVQLLFSRSLTFGSEVRTAQGFVAQTADSTVYAVDADRFATVLSDFDGIGKREADAVFVGAGQDVAVAFDAQAVTQFLRTGRAVVGSKGQTFVVHRVFRRHAFGDVGFGFVSQIQSVIGYAVGVFRSFADFNRTVSRLAEGGLVGVDGVLGVVAVHFFADGHVLTGDDGGGFFSCDELFVQLGDVDGVGAIRTFGNFGNLVAAVVQTVFGQADGFFAAAWHWSQGDAVCCGFGNIAVFVSQGNIAAVDGGHVAVGFKVCAVQTLQLFGKFDVERTVGVV